MTVRILIVDDALFMRTLLRDIFEKQGWEVVGEAENGQEAVEQYRRLKPDLVTMDIVMPEKNGLDALWEITSEYPEAAVVMCSALGQDNLVLQAVQYGARDFIVKPVDEDRLLEVVHRILEAPEAER